MELLNFRVTYERARVQLLERLAFRDEVRAVKDVLAEGRFNECALLQTCNRVEFYAVAKKDADVKRYKKRLLDFWSEKSGVTEQKLKGVMESSVGVGAITHLLRLASGLESMIVGEDQILGQVRSTYLNSRRAGGIGKILDTVFKRALQVGARVRCETGVNKGMVSIGSAAVDFAERTVGDLRGRNVLVIGAGETGTLVGKALAKRRAVSIFVANRTYESAVRLARELKGKAVRLEKLDGLLPNADVIIVATSAPHFLITEDRMKRALSRRRKRNEVLVIDISSPKNVDEKIEELAGVRLCDIDSLICVTRENLLGRLKEAKKANKIVEGEAPRLERRLRLLEAEDLISRVYRTYEVVRKREVSEALRMAGKLNPQKRKVVEDLSHVLMRQFLHSPTRKLCEAYEKDPEFFLKALRLFTR